MIKELMSVDGIQQDWDWCMSEDGKKEKNHF